MQPSHSNETRRTLGAFGLIAGLALVQRQLVMANPDVAWLLTVAEKMFDGARLYVDVLETNPPASAWLYMPFAWLGRVTALRAELWVDIVFLMVSAASAWTLGAIWREHSTWLRAAGFAILALLPASCFGEREHVALILYLPVMGLACQRSSGIPIPTGSLLGAAALIGMIACIKPHFVIVIALTYVVAALIARSWRVLFAPEALMGAALFAGYVASIFVVYPDFWSGMIPISNLLYIPARLPILAQLHGSFPVIVGEVAIVAGYLWLKRLPAACAAPIALAAAGSVGFLIVALLQGKGWPYHYYPALGLVILIGASLLASDADNRFGTRLITGGVTLTLCVQTWLLCNSGLDLRAFHERLRVGDPHPRMASLASDFALGFPTVRALDGTWVGRSFSRWIPYHVAGLSQQPGFDPSLRPRFEAMERADMAGFIEDIQRGRPTLILTERRPFDFAAWAKKDPQLAALLACYDTADRFVVGSLDTPQAHGLDVEVLRPRAGMTAAQWQLGCATAF